MPVQGQRRRDLLRVAVALGAEASERALGFRRLLEAEGEGLLAGW